MSVVFGQSSTVPLPTKGLFYSGDGNPFPDGHVTIKPLNTAVDKLLAAPGLSMYEVTNIYIGNSCELPRGFTPNHFTQGDRLALMFGVRAISSGVTYDFRVFCQACSKQTPASLSIPEMKFYFAEDTDQEPFETQLPISGSIIQFRLLRGFDEQYASNVQRERETRMEQSTVQQLKSGEVGSIMTRSDTLSRLIVTIDGRPIQSPMLFKREIAEWNRADLDHLDSAVDAVEPRPDLTVPIHCVHCRSSFSTDIPILPEFFRSQPVRRKRGSRAAFVSQESQGFMERVSTNADLRKDDGAEHPASATGG